MAGSRIAVEIVGSSSELQAAAAKAAESLKSLGTVLAKQTDSALGAGERTVRMNEAVAKSFQGVAAAASSSTKKTAVAYTSSADEQVAASRRVSAAVERQTALVRESAVASVQASRETAAASVASAGTMERSARRSEAAFGASASGITKAGKMISLGLLGAAAASVDLAVKFQANTLRLQTQAGATERQMNKLRAGILAMAPAVGIVPNKLADGMYHVVSSMNAVLPPTQRVAGELRVLRIAAELAVVGHSSLEETTYALASAMNALHSPIKDTAKVAGQLNAIVGSGDMTMTDLIESLKSGLLPAARTTGVSLQSVGAAMAVMGDQGMKGSLAGTRLRMSLALLSAPSKAAATVLTTLGLSSKEATSTSEAMSKALLKAGLNTTQLGADLRQPNGIMVALRDLNDHLRKSGLTATGAAAVMNKAFGGGRMGATITLLANSTDRLKTKFDQIGHTAGSFGAAWHAASHSTAFELKQVEVSVIALATQLGTDLLPVVKSGIDDLRGMVHWFEKNKLAAEALGGVIVTFATVAVGSYFVSKIKQAIGLARDLRTALMFGTSKLGITTAGGSAASVASQAAGGIWGARGPRAPGSIANPIVVVMEAGEFAGLSSMGAAGTVASESGAARAEAGAINAAGGASAGAAGAAESAAASGGVAAAESAAGVGLLSSLKSGLGTVLKSATFAGGGLLAGNMVKGMVPGKVGVTLGNVTEGAGFGAALGSIFGPEGTIPGAIVGALAGGVATFLAGPTPAEEGRAFADKFTADLPGKISAATKTKLATATGKAAQQGKTVAPLDILAHMSPGSSAAKAAAAGEATAFNALFNDVFTAGKTAGQAFAKGFKDVGQPTVPILIKDFATKLNQVPEQIRAEGPKWVRIWQNSAAQQMVAYAASLQRNGKLPKGSVEGIIASLELQFPGLTAYLDRAGAGTAAVIARAMKLSEAQANWKNAINHFRTEWGDLAISQNITSGNIVSNTKQAMSDLKNVMATGSHSQRIAAQHEYDQLRSSVATTFTNMVQDVSAKQASMTSSIKTGSQGAADAATTNFENLQKNIWSAMSAGVLGSATGARLLQANLNALLKAFGGKHVPDAVIVTMTQAGIQGVSTGVGGGHLKARGGLMQVGPSGARGPDAIPMSVGGQNIVVGAGEQVAVFNHQQQQVMNQRLADVGGLQGMFARFNRPHYMAQGGMVPGFAQGGIGGAVGSIGANVGPQTALPLPRGSWYSSPSVDQGVDYPAPAGTPEYAMGAGTITARGITGFGPYAPILSLDRPLSGYTGVYYGHAGPGVPVGTHVAAGQQIGSVGAGILGISSGPHLEIGFTPFGPKGGAQAYAMLHLIQAMLGGQTPGAALFGSAGAASAIPAVVWNNLKAPTVQGTGTVPEMVRAALVKATAAANAYGQKQAGMAGASGGGNFGAGSPAQAKAWTAQAMKLAGVSGSLWENMLLRQEMRESSYSPTSINRTDINAQRGDPSEGILQTTLSTFAQYHLPGHDQILNPVDNIIAAIRYMIATYGGGNAGTAAQVMWNRGGGAYAQGGMVKDPQAHAGSHGLDFPFGLDPASGGGGDISWMLDPKAGTGRHGGGLSLGQIGQKVGAIEGRIATELGQYSSMSSRFGVVEAGPQYLNADGSMNAAGIAKQKADDETLLGIAKSILGDYKLELPLVEQALRRFLGKKGTTERSITADEKKLNANKIKESGLRTAILDLGKPSKDQVSTIEAAIKAARLKYGKAVNAAAAARKRYRGKDKSVKAALSGAVLSAEQAEHGAIDPLEAALLTAQGGRSSHALSVKQQKFHLRQQLNALISEDTKLRLNVGGLKGILSGAGGASGTNSTISSLEAVAGKLGTVQWDRRGKFLGINTHNQGAAYDEETTILQLQNAIGLLDRQGAGTGTDNATLIGLLQQQNLILSEEFALSQAQTNALRSMIPEIPQYAQGGPTRAGLAELHDNEFVVPQGGALVKGGGGGPTTVEVHQHFHGSAGDLMRFVDQRVQHDGNVHVISKKIGQRTSMLTGAPGGFR